MTTGSGWSARDRTPVFRDRVAAEGGESVSVLWLFARYESSARPLQPEYDALVLGLHGERLVVVRAQHDADAALVAQVAAAVGLGDHGLDQAEAPRQRG